MDAVWPGARGDDDPADIRRLATRSGSPARQEEEVVWSWLILRSEDPVMSGRAPASERSGSVLQSVLRVTHRPSIME